MNRTCFLKPAIGLLICLLPFILLRVSQADVPLQITTGDSSPQLEFAKLEISRVSIGMNTPESSPPRTIRLEIGDLAEGYRIVTNANTCVVTGANANETMYGGLEVAERIRLQPDFWQTRTSERKPYLKKRGIKFNIPLDARTPSYDDSGDAAQRNIAEMWNESFWFETLDQMARNRYNVLTLWNPHPFPSMIKLADYPDVALDDVCVTTLKPGGRENEWGEPQLVSSNVMANLRTVKTISIDQKIQFWRDVMQHAHDRGIEVSFITWNICPNSVARPVPPMYRTYGIKITDEPVGKYGVNHQVNNPETIKYVRAAVKQFLLTYPHVTGIGVTAGEHMPQDWEQSNREQWLWDTYGEGILDAKGVQPDRHVNFIHRVWYTDLEQVMKVWRKYPDSFELSFKYAKARLYSSPNVPFARQQLEQMKPYDVKCWWNLRNDDIFVFRWGDPDYVRKFLLNFDRDKIAGYMVGSDGYVWGREFASRHPESPRELEYSKHWYAFGLWGRLGYDPELDNDYFTSVIGARFPTADAKQLFNTWQTASQIIPQVNRFYWQDWDHMWSVESCRGHIEGFHEVDKWCDHRTMEGSGIATIRDFVKHEQVGFAKKQTANGPMPLISPLEVADNLDRLADEALNGAKRITSSHVPVESTSSLALIETLGDIESMAWLGHYYANKIRAAVDLARYESTGAEQFKQSALLHIENAFADCQRYTSNASGQYESQMLARSGPLDWEQLLASAKDDVNLIRSTKKK